MFEKIKRFRINRRIKSKHFHVTIFGSARITRKDKSYKQVYELAKLLGKREIDVVTGGGPGAMEAANKGHIAGSKGNGSHSIGIAIKLPTEQKINSSVMLYEEHKRFSGRLDHFMLLSDVIIVSGGGIGTLLELFYTWQLVQVKHICKIPIILLGEEWKGLLDWMNKNVVKKGYVDKDEMNLVFLAKTPKEALDIIDEVYEEYKKGNKDFCVNYEKYKLRK